MTRAWQHFEGRPLDRIKGWLLTMVYNEARNTRRGEARRMRTLNEFGSIHQPPSSTLNDGRISIEELDLLRSVLASMSTNDREVLALSWWEEQSDEDVAQILDITKNAAAVRLSRASARFSQAMRMVLDNPNGSVA